MSKALSIIDHNWLYEMGESIKLVWKIIIYDNVSYPEIVGFIQWKI